MWSILLCCKRNYGKDRLNTWAPANCRPLAVSHWHVRPALLEAIATHSHRSVHAFIIAVSFRAFEPGRTCSGRRLELRNTAAVSGNGSQHSSLAHSCRSHVHGISSPGSCCCRYRSLAVARQKRGWGRVGIRWTKGGGARGWRKALRIISVRYQIW